MKIGMMTGLWHVAERLGVMNSLERVSDLGFQYVDLHGVFHAGPAHLNDAERVELKTRLDHLCLKPRNYVLHAPHNIPSADAETTELCYTYLCEGVDMAVEWGINQMMLNAGQWVFDFGRGDAWNRAVDFIQRVCKYAAEKGVFIAQEAEPYVWFLVNDVASTLKMINDVNQPNFTTLVDLGHMALAREGTAELDQVIGSVIHAHFSDHEPYRHSNQVVGTGFTPYQIYLNALRDQKIDESVSRFGYRELVISFELGMPGDRISDPDDMARRSLAHIQEVAPFLDL